MRKPYSQVRVRGHSEGWTKREAMVALVSVVVSACGVVVSAVSSLFAWQQAHMLSQERMTPYRTVLFSAKLDSYKNTMATGRAVSSDMDDVTDGVRLILDKNQAERAGYNRVILVQKIGQLQKDVQKYADTRDQTSVVWPLEMLSMIDESIQAASQSSNCAEMAGIFKLRNGKIEKLGVEDSFGDFRKRCGVFALKLDKMRFNTSFKITVDSMRSNLQADRLQKIVQ